MPLRRSALVLALTLTLAAAVAVAPAAAEPPPDPTAPTLTGETLKSLTGSVSDLCQSGTGNVSFRVTGVAAGPYFGTFEERGSITFSRGVVTGFKALFWITSEAGSVQGTKVFLRSTTPVPFLCVGQMFAAADVPLRYTAQIITPLGIFSDTGISRASLAATNTKTVSLRETFVSSLETATLVLDPPGMSPPVVPGQGCGDENHLHEDAALCSLPDAIDETPLQ